jgi:hypothetical protein
VDTDCATGRYCLAGACVAQRTLGETCAGGGACAGGRCDDGVCCNRACGAQCEACDVTGSRGTCSGVVGAPRGGRAACTGTGVGTTCGAACDGKELTRCTFAKTTTFCSATTCTSGVETHASFCNGTGACGDVPTACGAYACGAFACRTTCAATSDCAAGYYCKGSACAVIEDLGTVCTDGSSCKTGFCVDGVCCGSSSCDAGSSCAVTGKAGTCTKRNGASCTVAAECGSGFCVDGLCCDRACDGQCEACDVSTSKGACVAIVGEPHGPRTRCETGSTPCAAKRCDGTDAKNCAAYAAATVACGAPTCSGASFTSAMHCDGKGACAAAESTSCVPFACDDLGCLSSCSTDAHCAPGFECRSTVCEAKRTRCSEDLAQSIAVDGSKTECAPYRCGSTGVCGSECATSSDCGGGNVCDGRACVPVSSIAPEESGCAYGGRTTTGAWLVLLALVAIRSRGARPRS